MSALRQRRIRETQLRKLSSRTCNQRAAGLTFFYRHVLDQQDIDLKVRRRRPDRLLEVLSAQEVRRLIDAAANGRDRHQGGTMSGALSNKGG